jgi:hypothetical protein
VRVTLIDKRPILLDFVDDQIVEALMYQMRNTGCTFPGRTSASCG